MESTSILSLNDDCLKVILSFVNDFRSFYSFSLTCKQLYQATLSTRDWHANVLKRKIKFYAMQFVIDEYLKQDMDHRLAAPFLKIEELVQVAKTFNVSKPTYFNVLNVWKSRGPVAAKLFTWIRGIRLLGTKHSEDIALYPKKELMFYLPMCRKELTIKITYDHLGDQATIEFTCDDIKFESKIAQWKMRRQQQDQQWVEDAVKSITESIKPTIALLQKELGETIPPITSRFFLWFCFFPDSLELLSSSNEEDKYFFKNYLKNEEPTPGAVQQALERFTKNKSFMSTVGESENVRKVAETVNLLKRSVKDKILCLLNEEVAFFFNHLRYFKEVPIQVLHSLVLRTDILPVAHPMVLLYGREERTLQFRMKNQDIVKNQVVKEHYCDLIPLVTFFTLDFQVPGIQNIHSVLSDAFLDIFSCKTFENQISIACLENIQPVTDILKDCLTSKLTEQTDFQITNHFTVMYFVDIAKYVDFCRD